ncbi:MAG: hypothetical protein ABF276_07040 [Sulfurovum sp.]
MLHRKSISLLVIVTTLFYLTGCSSKKESVHQSGYYHSGIYFGKNFSANYQQGIADGCSTSKGVYTKSHTLFNNDKYYNDGWFLGRNKCRHLLVIEDEKKEGN